MAVTVFPESESPFGTGPKFVVSVPADVKTYHGNVSVPAGLYEAQQSTSAPEGTVSVWSPEHYAGPLWTSLPAHLWAFPGEAARPLPEHDCVTEARSAVAGPDIFCAVCHRQLA